MGNVISKEQYINKSEESNNFTAPFNKPIGLEKNTSFFMECNKMIYNECTKINNAQNIDDIENNDKKEVKILKEMCKQDEYYVPDIQKIQR